MSQMSQMSHTTDSNGYAPIVGLVGCVAFRCAIFAKVHSWHDAMCDATSEYRPGNGYAPIVGLVGCVAFRGAIFAKVHSWHDAMCDATSEYRPGQYTRVFITAKVALSPWRPRWSTREY